MALHRLQGNNYYDIPEKIDVSSWIIYWLTNLLSTYNDAMERCKKQSNENPVHKNVSIENEPRLKKAISLFNKHKQLRAAEYETLMGLGRTQAVSDLNQLVCEGIIERLGGGRSSKYQNKKGISYI